MNTAAFVLAGAVVGVCGFSADFAAAMYSLSVKSADEELDDDAALAAATRAGFWAVAIGVIGLVGVFGVLRMSGWFAIPELVGYFFGTRAGALWRRRRRNQGR